MRWRASCEPRERSARSGGSTSYRRPTSLATVPDTPHAQPLLESTNETPVRSRVVFGSCATHVAPPSVVLNAVPVTPTVQPVLELAHEVARRSLPCGVGLCQNQLRSPEGPVEMYPEADRGSRIAAARTSAETRTTAPNRRDLDVAEEAHATLCARHARPSSSTFCTACHQPRRSARSPSPWSALPLKRVTSIRSCTQGNTTTAACPKG